MNHAEIPSRVRLTGYGLSMSSTLPARNEDHIALAGVGIVILEIEDLVDAIVLESRELHKETDRTCEIPLKDEVLLPPDLNDLEVSGLCCRGGINGAGLPYLRPREGTRGPCGLCP